MKEIDRRPAWLAALKFHRQLPTDLGNTARRHLELLGRVARRLSGAQRETDPALLSRQLHEPSVEVDSARGQFSGRATWVVATSGCTRLARPTSPTYPRKSVAESKPDWHAGFMELLPDAWRM